MISQRGSSATRVLLVDDHKLLAESLALALGAEGFSAQVADLTDRDRLIELVRDLRPDLVLLDLDLGGSVGDGATLVRPFREAGARVLVVSGSADPCWRGLAIEQGAVGALSKRGPFEQLLGTVMAAARGEDAMTPQERQRVLREMHQVKDQLRRQHEPFQRLTDREQHVLQALGQGKSVCHMAQEWFVSEATVRTQVRAVLMKLGVNSQLEAVASAHRAGWLAAEPELHPA